MMKTILIYGNFDIPAAETPVNFFLLRYPECEKWRVVMQTVRNFLRDNHGVKARNGNLVAPYFNVDGDIPDWDTTRFPRYEYINGILVAP